MELDLKVWVWDFILYVWLVGVCLMCFIEGRLEIRDAREVKRDVKSKWSFVKKETLNASS